MGVECEIFIMKAFRVGVAKLIAVSGDHDDTITEDDSTVKVALPDPVV